jgi:hypothetical protein
MSDLNEILTVRKVTVDGSERCVVCPHCQDIVGLPGGPLRGEQFQHRLVASNGGCKGWFEISYDAVKVRV